MFPCIIFAKEISGQNKYQKNQTVCCFFTGQWTGNRS